MSESLLQKEFKEKDLARIRNLIKKDYSKTTSISSGYEKIDSTRKEGEVWEEDGRSWTIKNGIRQNITKLDDLKRKVRIPLACPKCGGSMSYWLSKKMFKIHQMCFDCVIEYEAQLRKAGLYEEYERTMMKAGVNAFVKDLEGWLRDNLSSEENFISEHGDIEEWREAKKQKKKVEEKLQEFLTHMKKSL